MLKQSLQHKLQQKLSPQQIQLMKLLQVPTLELEARIKEELGLDGALSVKDAIKEANEQMGLEAEGSLPQQANALLAALEI